MSFKILNMITHRERFNEIRSAKIEARTLNSSMDLGALCGAIIGLIYSIISQLYDYVPLDTISNLFAVFGIMLVGAMIGSIIGVGIHRNH